MDANIQLKGVNDFLSTVYGEEKTLGGLMRELGFAQAHIEQIHDARLQSVVDRFLDEIRKRLTNDAGKDTYYQILARRYGLDGEPAEQLSSIAPQYDYSVEYLRRLFEEILERCRSRTWQTELKRNLKFIAAAELGKANERPSRGQVAEKLQRLTNLRGATDVTRLDYESKRAEILKKVQAELDSLEAEYQPLLKAAEENIAALENEIKTEVLLCGESVTGGSYRAVYSQGRVSWDNEGLAKYAESYPDVMKFRRQGQPVITLRAVNAANKE